MQQEKQCLRLVCGVLLGLLLQDPVLAKQPGDSPVQVFVLAGQSNMQGQGVVDFDHPKYYNGGKGILKNVMKNRERAHLYKHIVDAKGDWIVRDDVFVRHQTKDELKTGGLTIGFTGYGGNHHIGPEFQLGHLVGEAYDEPVLLIKTAWGGKSIYKDFRPPRSGGSTGEFYKKMLAEYREGLAKLGDEFPQLAKRKPELSGFVWFQGWNDMFDSDALKEYEANLINLIKDVREEFRQPNLPVVIGELGNGGPKAGNNMLSIRKAQKAAAKALGPNTTFVQTTQFARPAKESPNVSHGHHWYGNAESYFLIGDALGQVHRHGEPNAGVHAADERVDAAPLAVNVHQRPAAIAGVDAGVGLDEVLVEHHLVREYPPPLRAHMANGDTVIKLVRRTDRDGELAHLGLAGVTQLRSAQSGGGDLHHGDVRLAIHAKYLTIVFPATLENDLHLIGVLNHVAVGEDDPVLTINQPGALPVEDRLTGSRTARLFISVLSFLLLALEKLAVCLW